MYEMACERLNAAGVRQYEISNFARSGHESRHNLKYWTRQPYLGFGVDAHSMLNCSGGSIEAVRFSLPDSLEEYIAGASVKRIPVLPQAALEETFFLGLRLTKGVDLKAVAYEFGEAVVETFSDTILECVELGLLERQGDVVQLTPRGRLLSNEVFERFILTAAPHTMPSGSNFVR
jgi:oxygen-independent coproporphyrinogen-3 oxidase